MLQIGLAAPRAMAMDSLAWTTAKLSYSLGSRCLTCSLTVDRNLSITGFAIKALIEEGMINQLFNPPAGSLRAAEGSQETQSRRCSAGSRQALVCILELTQMHIAHVFSGVIRLHHFAIEELLLQQPTFALLIG